jgi:hypothetical protein
MANTNTAASPLYMDRVKIGEATDFDATFDNSSEVIQVSDGTATTNGRVTTTLGFKTIVPRAGHKAKVLEALLAKKDVIMQTLLEGKWVEVTGKLKTAGYASTEGDGALRGSFQFVGGEPEILG